MATIAEESPRLGVRATCEALGVAPATYYRHQRPPRAPETRSSHRALGLEERQEVLDVATSLEFRDLSPKQMVPTLADRCIYLASEATVYRILREAKLMAHREPSRHPSPKPRELVATGVYGIL